MPLHVWTKINNAAFRFLFIPEKVSGSKYYMNKETQQEHSHSTGQTPDHYKTHHGRSNGIQFISKYVYPIP
jgi:hypothetical protein